MQDTLARLSTDLCCTIIIIFSATHFNFPAFALQAPTVGPGRARPQNEF